VILHQHALFLVDQNRHRRLMLVKSGLLCKADERISNRRANAARLVACDRLIKRVMNGRRYRIEYGSVAQSDLDLLRDRIRRQILRKIERLESGLHGDIKRLRRADAAYRLRMGDYRILFDVEGDVIVIRRIGARKRIYD
jgi:mRNA interferase RelE/StbE